MDHHHFLQDVVVVLAAAVAFAFLSRRLKTSPILGYLAAGILIGPYGLGLIGDIEGTRTLAELGVVFLLFTIGLELSISRLHGMRSQIFGLGGAQFVITGLVIGGVAYALGTDGPTAALIGAALALSSTAVVLQLLGERGERAGRLGRTSFAILLLQDLAAVPLLAVVPALGGDEPASWSAAAIAVAKASAMLVAIVVGGRLALRPVFRAVAATRSGEVFAAFTLLTVLGIGLAADRVGLSLTLGAFLAGLLLAETEFRHQVEAEISPYRGLLLGLFFITIGMSIDLSVAARHWALVAALTAGLIVIKAAILIALCRLIGLTASLSGRVGLLLAQGGEFAFIVVGLAGISGVIPFVTAQVTMVVVSISIAATPLLAILGRLVADRLERETAIGLAALEEENIDLQDHVIIAGFGRFGQMLARAFDAQRIPYVAFDMDPARVRTGREAGLPIHYGDASRPELLWGVGADRARAAVITFEDPIAAYRIVSLLKSKLPGLTVVVRTRDNADAVQLAKAGAIIAQPGALASILDLTGTALEAAGVPREAAASTVEELRNALAEDVAEAKEAA